MSTIILHNGPIYTLDPAQPRVQAIAIRDGRIIAAGSEGKVQAMVGTRAEGINLQGRAVIPALTDAHAHFIMHGINQRNVNLDGIDDLDNALSKIAAAAKKLPDGVWLQGNGWNHTLWGGQWPTAEMLDKIVPNRPAVLFRKDGHCAWLNSKALQIAGIDEKTSDPAGGSIQREKGKPTGLLFETAMELIQQHIPALTLEDRLAAIQEATNEAHSYGMAGVHIPPSLVAFDGRQLFSDMQIIRERGKLRIRTLTHIGIDGFEEALAVGIRSGMGDNWLRIGNLKLFADGTLGSETAEMLSHYEGRRHLGAQTIPTEQLNDLVKRANAAGIAIIVHAIGDAANRRVLDAIEQAIPGTRFEQKPKLDERRVLIPNRIEHCQVLHPTDIPRFAKLGVIASMQPIHATSDIEVADKLWGPERCKTAYAWKSLLDSGAILAFGSDAPVEPLNPWLSVHAAVTRQRPNGQPSAEGWYPEQRLSVLDTLRAFTVGAAAASGTAFEQGTLMPGMLADLAVLSADPFVVAPTALHSIKSELTMIDGQIVWEKP
jgi:predicted amidohydrolase YtcJ